MDKDAILKKIKAGSYNQQQLLAWIECLPASNEKRKPSEYKVGDCFVHGVFKHPYVLLKKRKEDWLCGLLTSDKDYPDTLEICQSRFFVDKYFTKSLFVVTEINGSFINVYENNKHLREVFLKLKEILK